MPRLAPPRYKLLLPGMSPKKGKPKKTANVKKEPETKLEPIHGVSEADVEEAKESLKAEGESKRFRSLMVAYLLSKGQKDAYDALPLPLRKEFMWRYHAMKMKEKETKKLFKNARAVSTVSHKEEKYEWKNRFALEKEIGEEAAAETIEMLDKIDDRHRPDKTTGKDTPKLRQYKIYNDVGGEEEKEENTKVLEGKTELDSEASLGLCLQYAWIPAKLYKPTFV